MGKLIMELEKKINGLNDSKVKDVLLKHFITNITWETQEKAFTKVHQNDRRLPKRGRGILRINHLPAYALPLNMVFAFAPIEVCIEVANNLIELSAKEFTEFLAGEVASTYDMQFNERVMETIAAYAPNEVKTILYNHIATLSESEITAILFGNDVKSINFIKLFYGKNPETLALVNAVEQISFKHQQPPFATNDHTIFIKFFNYCTDVDAALKMINVLKKHKSNLLAFLIGDSTNYSTKNGDNLLHVIFQNPSLELSEELLSLLDELDDKTLIKLMTHRNKSKLTPLQLAFNNQNKEISNLITIKLMAKESLRILLTMTSSEQPYSLMHMAVVKQHTSTVSYFLLFCSDTEREHKTKNTNAQSMYDYAKKSKNKEIITLFDSLPLYRLIYNDSLSQTPTDLNQKLEECAAKIRTNPDILTVKWLNGGTLLHHAIEQENEAIVLFLLNAGSSIELANNKELNAVDLSLKNNNLNILKHITKSPNKIALENALAKTLKEITISPLKTIKLENIFNEVQGDLTLREFLNEYAEKNQLSSLFLLLEACRFLIENHDNNLIGPIKIFIENNIKSNKFCIIALLFLISPDQLQTLFTMLPQLQSQLTALIQEGLSKPAIISKLNWETCQPYLTIIQNSKTHLMLAQEQLKIGNQLDKLPPQLLQEYAACLPLKELIQLTNDSSDAILIILTLEQLFKEQPEQYAQIAQLQKKLEQQLTFYNQTNNRSNSQLFQCLNLVSHPQIKNIIYNFLDTMGGTSSLSQRINKLFCDYRATQPLLPGNMMYELFIMLACTDTQAGNPDNHAAYKALLSGCNQDDLFKIKLILSNILKDFAVDTTMLSSLHNSSLENQDKSALINLLFSLKQRSLNFGVADIISHALFLKNQATLIATENKTLNSLVSELDNIIDNLFTIFISDQLPVQSINFEKLEIAFDQARQTIEKSDYFSNLISAESTGIFIDTIKTRCKELAIKSRQSSVLKQTIVSATASNAQQKQLNSIANNLLHFVMTKENILSNAQQFLTVFFHYQNDKKDDEIFKEIAEMSKTLSENEWANLNSLLDDNLLLIENTDLLVTGLHILLMENPKNAIDLISFLSEQDESILLQFKKLCVNAHCHDFTIFLDLILNAKEHNLSLINLISVDINTGENITHWLEQVTEKLQRHSTRTFSLMTLIKSISSHKESIHSTLRLLEQYKINLNAQTISQLILSFEPALNSTQRRDKISALYGIEKLLNATTLDTAYSALEKLPENLIENIIQTCLLNLNHAESKSLCRNLLSLICQNFHIGNPIALKLIKNKLGSQDLDILGSELLITLANDILHKTMSTLEDFTIDGIWIQRLITSPEFVAACPPDILRALIERYRLISLTLKQDELNSLIKNMPNFEKIRAQEEEINEALKGEAGQKSFEARRKNLLEKSKRLLNFKADSSISALLTQLEEECEKLSDSNPDLANSALNTLHKYYANDLPGLRDDFFYRVSSFIYNNTAGESGDIANARDTIKNWVISFLDHPNFVQQQLLCKQNSVTGGQVLYDESGKEIAHLSESNDVLIINVDGSLSPVFNHKSIGLGVAIYQGMPFYNANQRMVGLLTKSGKLQQKQETIFQPNTSALILAHQTKDELIEEPVALKLLFSDVFNECALSALLENCEPEHSEWINDQIQLHLIDQGNAIPAKNMHTLVKKFPATTIFPLLFKTKNTENACELFAAILASPTMSKQLFEEDNLKTFLQFTAQHDAKELFADYLVKHHKKPDFLKGLIAFSQIDQQDLLSESLHILNINAYEHKTLAPETYESVMASLLASEASSEILWKNFLKADLLTKINPAVDHPGFSSFFFKHHCMPLLKQLEKNPDWTNSYQYRMLLTILGHQHEKIFPNEELRYSTVLGWSADEIADVTKFAKRHIHCTKTPDENQTIGNRLIDELVIRCANFGNVSLFYKSNTLDVQIATKNTYRAAIRNILPGSVNNLLTRLINWVNKKEPDRAFEELKKEQAIIDWQKLRDITWSNSKNHAVLPFISEYLMNYAGSTQHLEKLLNDYCDMAKQQNNPLLLHNLSHVLLKFPDRDVSKCIFNVLINFFLKNGDFVDITIYTELSSYSLHHDDKYFEKEINIINYLGQIKQYGLVKKCCELILSSRIRDEKPELANRIEKALLESTVEAQLDMHREEWYFTFYSVIKRWWNYGFNAAKNVSGLVKFCDEDIDENTMHPLPPQTIKSDVISGAKITRELELRERTRLLKERVDLFVKKEPPAIYPSKLLTDISVKQRPFFIHGKEQISSAPSVQKTETCTLG